MRLGLIVLAIGDVFKHNPALAELRSLLLLSQPQQPRQRSRTALS